MLDKVRNTGDPWANCKTQRQRGAAARIVEALNRRGLVTKYNASDWKPTNRGLELMTLRERGEQALRERRERAYDGRS